MSTPQEPGRPDDQSRYPGAPPPPDLAQQPPYAGGPGPAGAPYGNAPAYDPYATPGYGAPPSQPAVAPPKEVVWATYAMYASIALSLINLIATLLDSTGYKNAIRDADPDRTVNVDTVYAAAVAFAVVVTLVIAGLYVFLAINLRKGKSWARITTWIVVGVFTLFGLIGLGSDAPGFARVLGILILLTNAATLVLLAMRPSNQFFAATRQPQYPRH